MRAYELKSSSVVNLIILRNVVVIMRKDNNSGEMDSKYCFPFYFKHQIIGRIRTRNIIALSGAKIDIGKLLRLSTR